MYKYETHLHTSEGSACSYSSAADMVKAHKDAGYDGIFITDHWLNGNTAVPRDLPWEDRVELYCRGYEHALEAGSRIGLTVLFGIEYNVRATDFLVYGIDKNWLLTHEFYLTEADERAFFGKVHEDGGFIVHAHPFRQAPYIHHIRLYPQDIDGMEVVNASHSPDTNYNDLAKVFAKMNNIHATGGSDTHCADRLFGGGIEVPDPILTPADYYRQLVNDLVVPLERTLP